MATLLDWFGSRVRDAEKGIGSFINGAASTANDAVNNVSRAVAPQQQRPQVRPPQVGVNAPRPPVQQFKSSVPTVPKFNAATVSQNSVVKRPQPDFDPAKTVGDIGTWIDKNIVKPTIDTGIRAGNTVALPLEAGVAAMTGANKRPEVQQALYRKMTDSFVTPEVASGKATPLEFGKQLTDAGVQTANLIPTKGVVTGLSKGLTLNSLAKSTIGNAKLAGVLGTANTANDALQGREINAQSLGVNYGAPLVLGVGSEVLGGAMRNGANKALHAAAQQRQETARLASAGKKVQNVPISRLKSYEGAPDRARVEHYKKEIMAGRPIEPMLLMADKRGKFGVEDGKHRMKAYQELGIRQAPAKVITEADRKRIAQGGYIKNPLGPAKNASEDVGNGNIDKTMPDTTVDVDRNPALASNRPVESDKVLNNPAATLQRGKGPQDPSQPQLQDKRLTTAQSNQILDNRTQTRSLDNTAPTDLSYTNNTPDIDTKQYVSELNKSQKQAQKGSSNFREKNADFKEKFIDDLAPIEDRLNKAIKAGATVDPRDHITYQLDRSRRAEGVMNAYIRDNGFDKVIQNVPDTKEFDQYLIARHAKELDEAVTTGRSAIKDEALVRQLNGKYGEAAKEVYKYNQKLLDSSVEYGLISKETANQLKRQYPEYVPFNRIFNEDELTLLQGGVGKGNASVSKQGVVKRIKGSERAISSPLNSIIDKTRVVVEQGERNKAAQMLADYRNLPGNPFNLKEIRANETIGNRHTISYLDKGRKRTFEVDKEVAEAAKNMTRQEIGLWGRIAAVPARVLRGGATTVNVGFAGANVVKDIVGAAINSRHPFRIADPANFGKALAASLNHNGKYYQELMREGVSGTSFDMFRDPLKTNVNEIRSHKNIGTRAAYNLVHPSQWYRTLENTIGRSEDFGRALQYYSNKAGYKAANQSDEVAKILAADQARSNSTNFFRHGSVGKGVNLAIPYWNAGVQGARIQGKRIVQRPVQTLTKIGFVIGAPSAMIAMNNYSNEQNRQVMESIPDYEKDSNIIIVGPDAKHNAETGRWDGVYKIPVPPQHMGIHKTIQDAVRSNYTGKEFDLAGNLGRITEDYTTINPTSLKETANRYTPQGLKLIAEPMTNTNFYTGNKIIPDSQKNLPAADQYNDYTSGTAKILGKLTNTSPRIIDNTLKTGMGGAGQNIVNIADSILANTGAISKGEVKGTNVVDSVTKRFLGANSISPSDKADEKFGTLKKQVIESAAYKNASQYDKSRMLNRLESDINAVTYDAAGKSETKLSKKQKSLASNGFNIDTYTDLDADEAPETYAEKYQKAKEDFDKEGKNWSAVKQTEKKKELRRLTIQKDYDNDIVDLYGMSKEDISNYLADNDGKTDKAKQAELLYKYDRALYDAGVSKTMKFKYGPSSGSGKGKGKGGKKGNGAAAGKNLVNLTRYANGIRPPKTTGSSGKAPSMKTPQLKKTVTKKFAIKSASVKGTKSRKSNSVQA